jgi:hypothetical protein
MATRQQHQIVETATEARQAEPSPSVTRSPDRLHRAGDTDPRRRLVRVLPHLSGGMALAARRSAPS